MNSQRAKSHLTRKHWNEFARVALQSVDLSGQVLMKYQLGKARSRNPVKLKGRNDLVTGADLESCRVMKQHLKRFHPTHSFLAEEPEFSENNRSDFLWIIDPLDGTTFHNRGLPFFSSILALEVRGQTELGLVSSPFTGDVFLAGLGRGCTFWNRRLRKRRQVKVSGVTNLADVLVGYSYGRVSNMRGIWQRLWVDCFQCAEPLCVLGARKSVTWLLARAMLLSTTIQRLGISPLWP